METGEAEDGMVFPTRGNSGTTGDGYACPCNLDNLVHSLQRPPPTNLFLAAVVRFS